MGDKLLSIIIPAYNMEAYLGACLSSVVVSEFQRPILEVLIINDGSTDRTSSIAHSFQERYPEIFEVVDKSNGHYGSCINCGLSMARGKYIRILDADDTYNLHEFENFLIHLLDVSKCNPEVDAVLSDYCEVDTQDKTLRMVRYRLEKLALISLDNIVPMAANLAMHGITYRTELLRSIRYCQTEGIPYTDNEWRFLPFMDVQTIVYCPDMVYRYLLGRPGQTMQPSVWMKSAKSLMKVVIRMWEEYVRRYSDLLQTRRDVLENILLQMTCQVYPPYILHAPIRDVIKEFPVLEKRILASAYNIYANLNELVICSHYMPIRYVRLMRLWPRQIRLVLLLVRGLNELNETLARWFGRRT